MPGGPHGSNVGKIGPRARCTIRAFAAGLSAAGPGIGLRGALVAEIGYLAGLAAPVFPSTLVSVRRECFRHGGNAFISPCAIIAAQGTCPKGNPSIGQEQDGPMQQALDLARAQN
jgi:hypothetical protein